MAILSVPVKTMMKIVLVMAGAMTVLHKRLTCILPARQNMIFFQLFPAMEMSPNVNSRLEEMQPLLGEISTTL